MNASGDVGHCTQRGDEQHTTPLSRAILKKYGTVGILLVLVTAFTIPNLIAVNLGNLALIRVVLQQDVSATDSAEQWLEFGSPTAASFRSLTRLYLAQGQPARAMEAGKQAVRLKPGDLLSNYWLGQAYWAFGDKDTARQVWRGIPEFKARLQYLLRASVSSWGRNDIPGAEAALRTALDLDPEYGPAYLALGHLLIWDGARHTDVILALEQAVKYLPQQSIGGHFASGLLYYARGDSVRAVPYLKFVVEREPNLTYWYFLWDALRVSGDQAGAEAAMKELERLRGQIWQ